MSHPIAVDSTLGIQIANYEQISPSKPFPKYINLLHYELILVVAKGSFETSHYFLTVVAIIET